MGSGLGHTTAPFARIKQHLKEGLAAGHWPPGALMPSEAELVALFGVIGYGFIKLGMEPAPLLLGFILGPMMEENLRRALLLSRGDWSVFVTRGLSASLLAAAAVLLIIVLLPSVKSKREEAFVED